jgi:hypothetical protein
MELQKTGESITIRVKRPSYFVLGVIWILLAASCVPLVYRNPGEGYGLVVLITALFALTWWAWLLRVRLSVNAGYIEYREGILKSSKLPFRQIADIRDQNLDWEALDKEPGIMILNKNGDVSMLINPRPFKRRELENLIAVLKRSIPPKMEF